MKTRRAPALPLRLRLGALMLVLMMASAAAAQKPTSPTELNVGVGVVPPFVMQQNGALSGFDIDLWNAIAAQMNIKTNYTALSDVTSMLDAMRSKRVDILAAPIVITKARDEEFDFSLPIAQMGIQIMVRDTGESASTNPLVAMLVLLFSRTTVLWLGIAMLLVLIPAHLVWFFERNREDGIIQNRAYIPGIFEAIYWAVSCLATQAENMPHQWLARAFSIFWMFVGVVFVAFYTAQLTTTLTIQQIQGSISGPEDLPGKQVATIANTVPADYLRSRSAQVQEFSELGQLFTALQNKSVDAVVLASPVLLYYAVHEGKGRVKLVGPEFNVSPIAFCFHLDSPLRRRVNLALLTLRENGTYQQIYNKWFGAP